MLISLIFSPFIGMLYLNRGRLALLYLLAALVAVIVAVTFIPIGLHTKDWLWVATVPVTIVGTAHSWIIARSWNGAPPLKWYAHWYSLIGIYLLFPVVALLIRGFLYQPFDIPSTSMGPTLNPGDYIFVSKFAYNSASPQRGDVIVFRTPDGDFVKRVVGVPGDRVQMRAGVLFINGVPAAQRRAPDFTEACGGVACSVPQYVETLPGGRQAHILNWIPHGQYDDTPAFVVPADEYFVLGDNRDNSRDSRNGLGFIARDAIKGRVVRKFAAQGHLTWEAVQ